MKWYKKIGKEYKDFKFIIDVFINYKDILGNIEIV